MGLSQNKRSRKGSVPTQSLEKGLLGRGILVSVQQTSVSTGPDFDPAHVCVFTVEVALDNRPQYRATCRQAVRAAVLPELMLAGATVAVRVDPQDHARIALALGEVPPTVTIASSGGPTTRPAAWILEQGVPCRAAIVQSQALGLRSSSGRDMYAFVLTVSAEGQPPYQTRVGSAVPAGALHLVYPGNRVPAMRIPDGAEHEVAIDWDAALAQAEQAVA
jgi:hypothetical protein